MTFTRFRTKYVTPQEMNEILKTIEKITPIVYGEYERCENKSLSTHSWVSDKMTNFSVTTKWYDDFKPCKYILYKATGEIKHVSDPLSVYSTLRRYYKEDNVLENDDLKDYFYIDKDKKVHPSASPIVETKKEFDNKELNIYEYDLNSAYAWIFGKQIPNTKIYRKCSLVKENEIGFLMQDGMPLVHKGFADIVFPLMESPYKPFVKNWYEKKKNAKFAEDKKHAKDMLTISVGYLQKTNPFIRAYVINTCNEYMTSLMDNNTVMWNTDAIYCTKPRTDLNIGLELGQFKLEYQGKIRIKGSSYQLLNNKIESVSYRGTPKAWFAKDFNLLTDNIPKVGNLYTFNKEKFRICLNLKGI